MNWKPWIDRRRFCAGAAAILLAGRVRAGTPDGLAAIAARFRRSSDATHPRVLFLGNSFTREHDLPARVASEAAGFGFRLDVAMIAPGGHRLHQHSADAATREVVAGFDWDVLVLQDFSTEPLDEAGRARSRRAAETLVALGDAVPVLFATWPRAPGHPLYAQAGGPNGSTEMNAVVERHYDSLARSLGGVLAPVGAAFVGRSELYRADGYHASERGAEVAAAILAAAIAEALGLDDFVGNDAGSEAGVAN